jgi:hypothetical protein
LNNFFFFLKKKKKKNRTREDILYEASVPAKASVLIVSLGFDLLGFVFCSFGLLDATLAVGQGFQALYTNANGFADAFVAFWSTVSAHFADVDNVGFELLNEPYFGDVFENPGLLLPGVTDRRYLLPLYQRAVSAIRKNDFGRFLAKECREIRFFFF